MKKKKVISYDEYKKIVENYWLYFSMLREKEYLEKEKPLKRDKEYKLVR